MSLAIDKNFDFYCSLDLSRYSGKWIAILDQKIIAVGDSFKDVFEKAKMDYPSKRPLFDHVSDPTHHFLK